MITIIRMDRHGPDHTVITATAFGRNGLQHATVQCYHNLDKGRTGLAWEKNFASEGDALEHHEKFLCGLSG